MIATPEFKNELNANSTIESKTDSKTDFKNDLTSDFESDANTWFQNRIQQRFHAYLQT